MKSTVTTYIGVGSNLGNKEANLRKALAMLIETPGIEIRRISAFLTNPAQGGPEGAPEFLNCAVEVVTSLSPKDLMKRLLEIEQQIGRIRREKWEPRVIDLDLLLHGNTILSTDTLSIPHPLMHERLFVLKPLAEIAPNALHPTLGVNVKTLLHKLETARHN